MTTKYISEVAEESKRAQSDRKQDWRNRNREAYNKYQREYMRSYRAGNKV